MTVSRETTLVAGGLERCCCIKIGPFNSFGSSFEWCYSAALPVMILSSLLIVMYKYTDRKSVV